MRTSLGGASIGGTGASILVAASNTSQAIKDRADFVCDGTDDQVEIMAAIAAAALSIPDHNSHGVVQLSPGNFTVGATITIGSSNPVAVRGAGVADGYTMNQPSQIHRSADVSIFTCAHVLTIENLMLGSGITGGAAPLVLSSQDMIVMNSALIGNNSGTTRGIEFTGYNSIYASNSTFQADQAGVKWTTAGSTTYGSLFAGCYFYTRSAEYCLELPDGSGSPLIEDTVALMRIVNCWSDGNARGVVHAKNSGQIVVANNQFYYDDYPSIWLENCAQCSVTDNQIGWSAGGTDSSIKVDGGRMNKISGNTIYHPPAHGILLTGTSDNIVQGNLVEAAGQHTTNTYSGIILDANSDRNLVTGNMVRHGGLTNKALYGLRVNNANCDDNVIYGNDLKNSANTGGNEFSDIGTGTITTAGNRV